SMITNNNNNRTTKITWQCSGRFEAGYRFGRLNVVCEGWDGPEDEYILEGSCALEFSVVRDPLYRPGTSRPIISPDTTNSKSEMPFGIKILLIFLVVAFLTTGCICKAMLRANSKVPSSSTT